MSREPETQPLPRQASLLNAVLGRTFSGFEVVRHIGSGGMGSVFLARQTSIDRMVALKVVREGNDPSTAERFLREARVISTINHANVVQLIDFGHLPDEGLMFYAMEHIDGVPLSRITKRGRLHANLAVELGQQICSALAEAHAHGVVHRDLKPENMLVSTTAERLLRLRVLDFGIAQSFEDTTKLTQTGILCGTPAYMAPEVVRGEQARPAADLYALGINLHLMLVGEVPFRGGNSLQVLMRQLQDEPPSLAPHVQRCLLPRDLAELCEALLVKDPRDRPASAVEVRARLLEIRRRQGWEEIHLEPAQEVGDLTRPALREERDDIPTDWRFDHDPATEPLLSASIPPLASDASVSRSGPILQRDGADWEAFHHTPAAADAAPAPVVISPVTGDYMSVGSTELAPQPRPASVAPTRAARHERVFRADELVPDLPPRGDEPGPAVADTAGASFADVMRFVALAIIACGAIVAVIGALSSSDRAPEPATAPVFEEPAVPEDQPSQPTKRPRASQNKTKPDKPKPIDLFEDVPDDTPTRPIVIEEESK